MDEPKQSEEQMSPGWNDRNETEELDDEERMICEWIDDRYEELLDKHGIIASSGPCHVALDDQNYYCIPGDTEMAAYVIVCKLQNMYNFEDSLEYKDLEHYAQLYEDYPLDVLFDSYLTLANIVEVIGARRLENL